MSITPESLSRLRHLQQERKFAEEDFYPGAPTEEIRRKCEQRVNDFLESFIDLLRKGAPSGALVARSRELEAAFHDEDTEEREKVGDYIGEAMRIIGVKHWDPADGEDPRERDRYFGFNIK